MKTIKQLLREPLKTITGIILMTLAAAILCVSVGQAFSVRTTTEKLNSQFATAAIPQSIKTVTENTIKLSVTLEEELLAWLEKAAAEHPDVVKQISRHGILSAYSPELTPLNITKEKCIYDTMYSWDMGYYYYQAEPYGVPYSCAMLVITLEEVSRTKVETGSVTVEDRGSGDFESLKDFVEWWQTAEKKTPIQGYTYELTGTVTDVLSLQEGYRDPVGRTARLTLTVPTMEQFEALELTPGKQYIVYGMDYVDEYWKFISEFNPNGQYDYIDFESYDPSKLELLEESELERFRKYYELFQANELKDVYARFYGVLITQQQYAMINAISMTLDMPVSLIEYDEVRNEEGILQELIPQAEVNYVGENGETVTSSIEEYTQRYQIPTIAPLEGSVDDFLNSSEGALWKAALERDAVNNQAFAVIGVDNLNYLADFSLQKTKIVAGRDFTAEELNGGGRVCIIHEELAETNGITVGDTITASFYTTDQGLPYQNIRSNSKGLLNPTASFYFETTPFTETAEYTVVGICRGERTFPNVEENEYAFSANTIYVPKSSVQTPMETCNSVAFITPVIHNGKLEEFIKLATISGYEDCFKYSDQGYSAVAANFHNYEELAKQVVTAGITVYTVILVLFISLYTVSKRKNIGVMKSLGASGGRRYGHVFTSNMTILLLASILGCLLGTLLWDLVADVLQKSAETAIVLQIEQGTLLLIAAAQFLFALILNALASALVVIPAAISKRR